MTINEYSSIYNDVAKKLLGEYAKSQENKNIVLSPMSIIMLQTLSAEKRETRLPKSSARKYLLMNSSRSCRRSSHPSRKAVL